MGVFSVTISFLAASFSQDTSCAGNKCIYLLLWLNNSNNNKLLWENGGNFILGEEKIMFKMARDLIVPHAQACKHVRTCVFVSFKNKFIYTLQNKFIYLFIL